MVGLPIRPPSSPRMASEGRAARMRDRISSSERRSISVTTSVGLDFVAATSTWPARSASKSPASLAAPMATATELKQGLVAYAERAAHAGLLVTDVLAGLVADAEIPGTPVPPVRPGAAAPVGSGSSRRGSSRPREGPGTEPAEGQRLRAEEALRDELADHRANRGVGPGALARANGRPSDAAVSAASTSRSCTTSMWSLTKPTGTTTTAEGGRLALGQRRQVVVHVRLKPGHARRPAAALEDEVEGEGATTHPFGDKAGGFPQLGQRTGRPARRRQPCPPTGCRSRRPCPPGRCAR